MFTQDSMRNLVELNHSLEIKKDAKTSDCALVADEKISDTLLDIATYCIMTVEEMQYD